MNALLQRLDRLTAALEGAPRSAAVPALAQEQEGSAPQRTPAAGDTPALLERIEALEATLAAMQHSLTNGAAVTPRATASSPMLRPESVQQLRAQLYRDDKQNTREALRSLFLLGPNQVLDRLGTPSNVSFDDKGNVWRWGYEHGETSLTIAFVHGVVMAVD